MLDEVRLGQVALCLASFVLATKMELKISETEGILNRVYSFGLKLECSFFRQAGSLNEHMGIHVFIFLKAYSIFFLNKNRRGNESSCFGNLVNKESQPKVL